MKRTQMGYTIVELITVMIVVGILAAIAIPRISNTRDFSASAYRNEIASALRHAQKSAVSHRRVVCADIAAQSITLSIAAAVASNNCNSTFASPDGNPYVSRDAKLIANGALVGQRLLFMPNGEIRTNGAGQPIAIGAIAIIYNADATGQAPIQINGNTGYVQ